MLCELRLSTTVPDNYLLFISFFDAWANILILPNNPNLLLMAQILLSYKNKKASTMIAATKNLLENKN